MKIIVNRTKAPRRLSDPAKTLLEIGANEVSDDVARFALGTPYFRECMKRGVYQVRDVPKVSEEIAFDEGDVIFDLTALRIVDALKAVAACDSRDMLQTWLEQDGRKRVREAIMSRGVSLLPAGDSGDGDTYGE